MSPRPPEFSLALPTETFDRLIDDFCNSTGDKSAKPLSIADRNRLKEKDLKFFGDVVSYDKAGFAEEFGEDLANRVEALLKFYKLSFDRDTSEWVRPGNRSHARG